MTDLRTNLRASLAIANEPYLLAVIAAARALLRVDDLHLPNTAQKDALQQALAELNRRGA